jgi:hypothetical protein
MYETVIENPEKAVLALMGLYYHMKSDFPEVTDDLEKVELVLFGWGLMLRDSLLGARVRHDYTATLGPPPDTLDPLEGFLTLIPKGATITARTSLHRALKALFENKTGRIELSLVTGKPECELKFE